MEKNWENVCWHTRTEAQHNTFNAGIFPLSSSLLHINLKDITTQRQRHFVFCLMRLTVTVSKANVLFPLHFFLQSMYLVFENE